MNGKELANQFCEININAMWVHGKGMIFMSDYYGTDCCVQGKYKLFSLATSADIFKKFSAAKAQGDEDPFERWTHDREISKRYYIVR